MDESDVTDLLSALLRQGEEQAELLRSIDARLVEVVQGVGYGRRRVDGLTAMTDGASVRSFRI